MAQRSDKLLAGQSARERALADRTTIVRPAGPARLVKLSLSTEEGFVISRIDRAMPLSDVLLICGLPEAHALQVLLNLMAKGALLLPGEAGAEEPAPPPAETSPYGDFIFSPRELNEDVDLDFEKRKQILFLYYRMEQISYYRLLGVAPTASDADIRKAYLERSRQFHPDNYFRKRLGSYLEKIEALFQRVKTAHETLMNPEARKKYERDARRLFTNDEVSALVQREIDVLEDERRQKQRRDQLLRSRGFLKLTRARDLVAAGDAALARNDVKDAIANYQAAMDLDPRLDEARARLAEARKVGQAQRADLAIEEASRVEREGNSQRAIEMLKSALELDATNARVYAALASTLLRWGGDMKEARSYVQRAMTLGDKSGKTRLLHGEILLALGLKKAAKIELEAAATMGEAARAETLLKEC